MNGACRKQEKRKTSKNLVANHEGKRSLWSSKFRWGGNITSKLKHDRQCTYIVTLRRVHETIVAVEKQ